MHCMKNTKLNVPRGAYVNGHVRPKNKKADRVDRRLAENQKADKRCVFVMRSRAESGQGGKRTLTFVMKAVRTDNRQGLKQQGWVDEAGVFHAVAE